MGGVFTKDSISAKEHGEQPSISVAKDRVRQIEEALQEMRDIKKDFMVIFGIFASVVAFLAVEVKAVNNYKQKERRPR